MREIDDLDWDASEHRLLDELKAAKRAKAAKKASGVIPERVVQKAISDQLCMMGYMVVRVNSSTQQLEHGTRLSSYRVVNINATSGHADLAVYRDGRAWMLEVKAARGRKSDSQDRFSDCCLRYGVPYGIVRSVDDAIEFVKKN